MLSTELLKKDGRPLKLAFLLWIKSPITQQWSIPLTQQGTHLGYIITLESKWTLQMSQSGY